MDAIAPAEKTVETAAPPVSSSDVPPAPAAKEAAPSDVPPAPAVQTEEKPANSAADAEKPVQESK
jgi:hypothetical protein